MAGSPRKLIVVDDDPVDVRFVMRAFSDAGSPVEIVHVADADIASDRLDREAFDYILLDINMPKVGGLEVLKQIRAEPHTRRLPVVMLTTSKEEQDLITSYDLGANSYVRKPVDFDQFTTAARNLGMYWLLLNELAP